MIRCGNIVSGSQPVYLTRPITLGILFSKALRASVVVKPVVLGILPSISVILAL